MLIDRYEPEDVFVRVPELAAQTDPVLKALDELLDDDDLYQQVRADLSKRYRFTQVHGRPSTPVEVILRMLICKHLYQWSFKETEERGTDSLVLSWFCRTYFQKVLSLFEPHTRAIPRHKGGALVEFGRQVILDEVEGGIVTRYEILQHPHEHGQATEAVQHHRAVFEHPPHLVTGDRGVHSAETAETLQAAGVKQVSIPGVGPPSQQRQDLEHTRRWKRGYRWRADTLGRIASLRRDYGWRKSAYHGPEGMERRLGLGVIASNLRHIAQGRMA